MERPIGPRNAFTFTEWHASVLGVVIGAFTAYLQTIGYTSSGVFLAVVFVAGALGVRVYEGTAAHRTVTKEPWYALGGFLFAGALVVLLA